jgi:hypothetical protein
MVACKKKRIKERICKIEIKEISSKKLIYPRVGSEKKT